MAHSGPARSPQGKLHTAVRIAEFAETRQSQILSFVISTLFPYCFMNLLNQEPNADIFSWPHSSTCFLCVIYPYSLGWVQ